MSEQKTSDAKEVSRAHGQKAIMSRHYGPDDPRTQIADTELRTAKLAEAIRKTVEALPPLTPEQRDRLAGLLSSGAQ